jgi:5-formyltetrahydrofolate cyclo-ligase
MVSSKSTLRSRCRTARQSLTEEEYRSECRRIVAQVASLPQLLEARTVLSYWPKIEAREIDIRPLNSWLRAQGYTVLLPIVEPYLKRPRMHWGNFDHECSFVANRWDIYEPASRSIIPAEEIDLVIVPGLGFDVSGHRIGYGGGFYDALFEYVDSFKLGMVIDDCLLDHLPADPHDVPVNCIVTGSRMLELHQQ